MKDLNTQQLIVLRTACWRAMSESEARRMRRGPYLEIDGYTLVVPGDVCPKPVATFWWNKGFHHDRQRKCWTRDTRQPLAGQWYTPAAWLRATRRRFYGEFYPELVKRKGAKNAVSTYG